VRGAGIRRQVESVCGTDTGCLLAGEDPHPTLSQREREKEMFFSQIEMYNPTTRSGAVGNDAVQLWVIEP
jgi:hypothetical protein